MPFTYSFSFPLFCCVECGCDSWRWNNVLGSWVTLEMETMCGRTEKEATLKLLLFGVFCHLQSNQILINSKKEMAHFHVVVSRRDALNYCKRCATMKETSWAPKANLKLVGDKIELQRQPTLQLPSCGFFIMWENIFISVQATELVISVYCSWKQSSWYRVEWFLRVVNYMILQKRLS